MGGGAADEQRHIPNQASPKAHRATEMRVPGFLGGSIWSPQSKEPLAAQKEGIKVISSASTKWSIII